MADERDQKSARDAFDDAQRADGVVFHTITWEAKDDDAAPLRDATPEAQPEGDGILSSLSTFEELRVGDEIPDPLTGKALCNNEVVEESAGSDALIDGGVHRIDLDDGHNPDDGSIMFET